MSNIQHQRKDQSSEPASGAKTCVNESGWKPIPWYTAYFKIDSSYQIGNMEMNQVEPLLAWPHFRAFLEDCETMLGMSSRLYFLDLVFSQLNYSVKTCRNQLSDRKEHNNKSGCLSQPWHGTWSGQKSKVDKRPAWKKQDRNHCLPSQLVIPFRRKAVASPNVTSTASPANNLGYLILANGYDHSWVQPGLITTDHSAPKVYPVFLNVDYRS